MAYWFTSKLSETTHTVIIEHSLEKLDKHTVDEIKFIQERAERYEEMKLKGEPEWLIKN
jgi:hypothetical protein